MNNEITEQSEQAAAPFDLGQDLSVGEHPMVRLVYQIIQQAIDQQATEILVIPDAAGVTVRYLIRNGWSDAMTLPRHVLVALVSRFKVLSGMNPEQHHILQNGRIAVTHHGRPYELQVACTSIAEGEQIAAQISAQPRTQGKEANIRAGSGASPISQTGDAASKTGFRPQRMAPPQGDSPIGDVLTQHALRGRDILGIEPLNRAEVILILDVAARLKANKFDATQTQFAQGQTLAMLFEKPSLRTRVTFEAGMTQLGGHAIYLEGRLGLRETVPDVARNLERWIDGVMARTFDHQTVVDLAENANIPVINGLSDREHPCQAFADFQTIKEQKGRLEGVKLAYIGDGNNVAHSLMLLAAKVGTHFTMACPPGYEPDAALWEAAKSLALGSGSEMVLTHDPQEAASQADVLYTDVWASMGQEDEAAERARIFAPFQINGALVRRADADAIVMHCLPAHRGEEITAEVLDGPQSVVFDQAENRLHAQKAILSLVL